MLKTNKPIKTTFAAAIDGDWPDGYDLTVKIRFPAEPMYVKTQPVQVFDPEDNTWSDGVYLTYDNDTAKHVIRVTGWGPDSIHDFDDEHVRKMPTTTKVDMTLFIDSPVMMDFNRPRLNHWNAVINLTEKPEWLKYYNFQLRSIGPDGKQYQLMENGIPVSWSHVSAIKLNSLKDNVEY